MSRRVVHFSCGAASAVAAKLTLAAHPDALIVNAFIKEEHEDNRRFLGDVEKWLGREILVLRDTKYGASAREVFRREGYMKGLHGAPCTLKLKRELLTKIREPGDVSVIGYTAEEVDRLLDIQMRNPGWTIEAPLIEHGLTKPDCLAMIERAGIALPKMYLMGYANANCIGCVKGGEGYMNKIRRDFPEDFEELCQIQEAIGPGAYLYRNRKTGERYSLRDMPPDAGRHKEPDIECSFFCQQAEDLYDDLPESPHADPADHPGAEEGR